MRSLLSSIAISKRRLSNDTLIRRVAFALDVRSRNVSMGNRRRRSKEDIHVLVASQVVGVAESIVRSCSAYNLPVRVECLGTRTETWQDFEERVKKAEIIVGDPPTFSTLLQEKCTQLKWFQSTYAGCDALLKSSKRDFRVTRLGGCVFGPKMAEYVVLHVLALERQLAFTYDLQRNRKWASVGTMRYRTLDQLTMGILGFGAIGAHVAKISRAVGFQRILGLRRSGRTHNDRRSNDEVDRIYSPDELMDMLPECDYVVNLLPSTEETKGLLTPAALASCEGRTVLINTGRGSIAKEADIVCALDAGYLRHAVLDVFANEPLCAQSKLWSHEKITVTPHVAATSSPDDVGEIFAKNLTRWTIGNELLDPFDWDAQY